MNRELKAVASVAVVSSLTFLPALGADTIFVPTDSKARYTVTNLKRTEEGLVEITTRRDGPSGTSTAKRLIDCDGKRFAYTEDDGVAVPNPTLGPLVAGSISYYVSDYACSNH
jgi:hypothetical protein